MEKIDRLRAAFQNDTFTAVNGMEILSADESGAVSRVTLKEEHKNGVGTVHGGLIFTLADHTFSALANFLHPVTVTQSATVTFLKPACGAYLKGVARERSRSRNLCYIEVDVFDERETLVASVVFTGYIKSQS